MSELSREQRSELFRRLFRGQIPEQYLRDAKELYPDTPEPELLNLLLQAKNAHLLSEIKHLLGGS